MVVKTVTESQANFGKDSALQEMAVILNALSTAMNALTAKLDLDAGVTDTNYASTIGAQDTISFRATGVPT